jgi:hypothetical protein
MVVPRLTVHPIVRSVVRHPSDRQPIILQPPAPDRSTGSPGARPFHPSLAQTSLGILTGIVPDGDAFCAK